ncbi:MAG: DNA topoisomerase VI subunit B [Haloarculaceae archaeon]
MKMAEELAASQREISIAEFFEKNKHMLGFDSGARGLVTAVKEAVDNALDAAEEAGILPDIYVEIEETGGYYRVVVEDNGPGLTRESLPKVFGKLLYGSRFHAREQSRGQQGIGISAAVLHAQLTSGKPARITSKTKGESEARYFELIVDTDENEPKISVDETVTWEPPHGTRIELEMEANMRARQQLHDYVKHTAVVNPHARIELREPKAHFKFERATDQLPAETEEIRPHPHGVELGTLIKMLDATDSYSVSGFLQSEFTRVGQKTADSVVANFRDRHFGREMAWRPPQVHEEADVGAAIEAAISNKSAAATEAFADYVVDGVAYVYEDEEKGLTRRPTDDEDAADLDGVGAYDRIAHHELERIVTVVAGVIEDEFDTRFGATVRENAVEAAWDAVTAERTPDLYRLVDEATTSQKDDAVVQRLAERVAAKFGEDPRDRVTRVRLREYVERAADMTVERDDATVGETARENVTDAIWAAARRVPDDAPLVREVADDRDTASELLEAMRETNILAPPTDCLAPITEDLVQAGLEKEYDADFFAAATRDAEVHGGDPFIVEAGIAYGGDLPADGPVDVLRFANRVPLVYQRGACATTDVVKTINWRNYGLDQPGGSGLPNGPAVLMVHVASTNVPFTSESKDAVANVPAIEDEIELALREAARELKSYLNKRRSLQKRRKKQNVLATILPEMAEKLADVTGREPLQIDDSVARIMNNVLVDREVRDGTVRLVVENNGDANADLDVTEIVSARPTNVSDGASVVEMDGEWFIKWSASVSGGDETALEYSIDDDATFDVSVDGVEAERLTVNA